MHAMNSRSLSLPPLPVLLPVPALALFPVLVLALVLAPSLTNAQTPPPNIPLAPVDIQNFWPGGGPAHTIALRSTDIQPHLSYGFALTTNYAHRPLYYVSSTGSQVDGVNGVFTTDFIQTFALFDRLQFELAIPLVVAQSGPGIEPLIGGGAARQLPLTSLRDVRFNVGVGIFQRARRTDATGFGLRADLGMAMPTGDRNNLAGAATFTFIPHVSADFRPVSSFTITANIGARVREGAGVASVSWASQLFAGLGVAWRPTFFDRLSVSIDGVALLPLYAPSCTTPACGVGVTYRAPIPVELYAGGRVAVDRGRDVEITLAAGFPLSQEPTVPAVRIIAGFAYSPHGLDNDRDGVLEANDQCPTVPEDRDGYQDSDGCPDPDNDSDGIPDASDRCVNEPEDRDQFQDDDGCPDPDNDGDGINDPEDQCVGTAAGGHPDPRHRGCPIPDRDDDGVLDPDDRCIEVPQGPRPDPEMRGCPLPDRDHDGVGDRQDTCPDEPAGPHADRFRRGCADPDRDHDGVPNAIDRCADEPETINGVTDDDGCADAGDEIVTSSGNAVLFRDAIHLRTGLRRIAPRETALFVQAAQRVRARGSEVVRVRVAVVAEPGATGEPEAVRLAGLVADSLAAAGIARDTIDTVAVPAPAATPTARPTPRGPRRPVVGPGGEVRVVIVPRPRT